MQFKKRLAFLALLVVCWTFFTYYVLTPIIPLRHVQEYISVEQQKRREPVIAILVIACNRPMAIKNHLDQLLKLRPSKNLFPIIVSQDCGHNETAIAIEAYGDQITFIQQPDFSGFNISITDKQFEGYYYIARHYHWALNQTFYTHNHDAAIITEDDLDISVDFFEYFGAAYALLDQDPTLWCVEAWNDNGRPENIEQKPDLLYRTDFFSGLGWMIKKSVWEDIEPRWPSRYWDDWMRRPEQRQNRACIRPEISRTAMSIHGEKGISQGLYFKDHLQHIQLNTVRVNFTQLDLSYLLKNKYDSYFAHQVYASPEFQFTDLVNRTSDSVNLPAEVRLTYYSKGDILKYTNAFKLMIDAKAGVPRTAYRAVIPFMLNGTRVFLAPPANWTAYDDNDWI